MSVPKDAILPILVRKSSPGRGKNGSTASTDFFNRIGQKLKPRTQQIASGLPSITDVKHQAPGRDKVQGIVRELTAILPQLIALAKRAKRADQAPR
jgi:hypothetical protein